jgi:hypothetical protein
MQCHCIKNGVPFDVAHALYDWELLAYVVTFGSLESHDHVFDWNSLAWVKKNGS